MIKPFVGIAPYGESDSPFFFGRDDDARVILANLNASRLTLLYGESGVGKSSILNARVVPQLRKAGSFPVVTFAAWSTDPAGQIRRAMAAALGDGSGTSETGTLTTCLLERASLIEGRLLLVLDQFEEYFQYRTRQPDPFLDQFSELVTNEDVPVNVLIAIREDALSSLDVFQGSIPQLFDNYLRLEHLSRKSAREAIEGPVAAYVAATGHQVGLENGLSAAVIESIGGKSERIPGVYLQIVMSALWEHDSATGLLRISTLEQLGGAHRIFESHFGRTIQERLTEAERSIVERMFTSLVTSSGRKQVQTLGEVARPGEREETHAVLQKLRAARILAQVPAPLGAPADEPAYEFVHDVLARAALEWRTGRSLELERKKVATERRAVRKFRALAWSLLAALLLTLLSGAWAWLARQEVRKAEQRAAKAIQDRQLAENQILSARLALLQAQLSRDEASARTDAVARAAKLVSDGKELLAQEDSRAHQAALALALYAVDGVLKVNQPASIEAEDLLRKAAAASSRLLAFERKTETRTDFAEINWSPDSTQVYASGIDSVVSLDRGVLQENVKAAAWNREGNRRAFVTVRADESAIVSLVEEGTGKILGTRELANRYGRRVKWNADLTDFATILAAEVPGDPAELAIWASVGNRSPVVVRPFKRILGGHDWSPDGSLILVEGYDEFGSGDVYGGGPLLVKILRPSGERVAILSLPPFELRAFVSWSPDNKVIVAFQEGRIEIFDPRTGLSQSSFEIANPVYGPAEVHPTDSRYVAYPSMADWNGTVVIWDSERHRRAYELATGGLPRRLSWSPDGTKLAVWFKGGRGMALHRTDFVSMQTQPELLKAARRYLQPDFRFSESECRQYFASAECPALP